MGTLKLVGYLVAGVAVLTALFTGVAAIIVVGIAFGLLLNLTTLTVFTASAIKKYFERNE